MLLAHPGGPYWRSRDDGAWTVPKGGVDPGEAPFDAARREFEEEMGAAPPAGPALELAALRQPSGKRVSVWAVEGDFDVAGLRSNDFPMEWPPRSGRLENFPEVDRALWFTVDEALVKILPGQRGFVEEVARRLAPPDRGRAAG